MIINLKENNFLLGGLSLLPFKIKGEHYAIDIKGTVYDEKVL